MIANLKYDGYQRGLASTIYKIFDKKSPCGCGIENENISNKELTEKLQKSIIRTFIQRKVQSSFL